MRVNMKKYQPKQPEFVHFGVKHIIPFKEFNVLVFLGILLVTYLVRLFSYSEPGPIYAASVAMTIFTVFFYGIYARIIMNAKANIYYRREYGKIHLFMNIHKQLSYIAAAICIGNVAYYISRSRIWNESGQIRLMFEHAFNPAAYLVVVLVSIFIIYYLFLDEHYIHAFDYNERMQMKVLKFDMTEGEAFLELLKEQDEFHNFSHIREKEEKNKKKTNKKIAPMKIVKTYEEDEENEDYIAEEEVVDNNDYDLYESSRIKRGE